MNTEQPKVKEDYVTRLDILINQLERNNLKLKQVNDAYQTLPPADQKVAEGTAVNPRTGLDYTILRLERLVSNNAAEVEKIALFSGVS